MLKRIAENLDPATPFTDEAAIQQWKDWQKHSASPDQAETERARQLGIAGCAADGPEVITALTARMSDNRPIHLFVPGSRNRATLAKSFLAPDCAGARDLAAAQIAELKRLADPAPSPTR